MAKNLTYPSTRKTTLGARLKIRVLPFNTRIPPDFTLTLTRAFNSNTNPGIIYLRANVIVFLSVETKLTFESVTVEVAENVTVLTTETEVSILDVVPNISIANSSSTITKALILVNGCKNFNISADIQTIDTTNVSHGIEKEEKQTFNSKKVSIEVVEIYNDIGGYYFLTLTEDLAYRNWEFWFHYSYPDGSFRQGAALITSYSPSNNQNTLRTVRVEARVQPGTYTFDNV